MDNKHRISIELAKLLPMIGFGKNNMEDWHKHAFTQGWRVRDDAEELYGSLTDDGYYELTVEGGGSLKWEDVYTNDWHISDFYPMDGQEFYLQPTIYEVQTFLRKTHHKQITVYSMSQESWQYRITNPGQALEDGDFGEDFAEYEDALITAIMVCVKQIIKMVEY